MTETVSPFETPSSRSAFANLVALASSSAYSSRMPASGYTSASSVGYFSADWASVSGTVGSMAQPSVSTVLYVPPTPCHVGYASCSMFSTTASAYSEVASFSPPSIWRWRS